MKSQTLLGWIYLVILLLTLSQAEAATFETEVAATYGQISSVLQPVLRQEIDKALGQDCYDSKAPKGPAGGYACGEYPFGKILNASQKSLLDLNVAGGTLLTDIKQDGKSVGSIRLQDAFRLSVIANRQQIRPKVAVDLLDQKKEIPLLLQQSFTDTMTVRHEPKGGSLYNLVCAYLPGLNGETTSTGFNTAADYTWHFLFLSGTERWSTYTKIKQGHFAVNAAKVCAVVRASVRNNAPQVDVLDVSYPELYDLKIDGLQAYDTRVELHTFGIQVAQSILNFFGVVNIKETIAQTLETEMQKQFSKQIEIQRSELEDGQMFKKLVQEQLNVAVTKNIVAAYKGYVARDYDSSVLSYRLNAEKVCQAYVKKLLQQNGLAPRPGLQPAFCRGLYADISISPFNKSPTYQNRGCYDHSYSPLPYTATGKSTWWAGQCGIVSKVSAEIAVEDLRVAKCLDSVAAQLKQAPGTAIRVESLLTDGCALEIASSLLDVPPQIARALKWLTTLKQVEAYAQQNMIPPAQIKRILANLNSKLVF